VWSGRSGSVRILSVAGHSAGDLDGHPKVALGVEVGDVNPAEPAAEIQLSPSSGLSRHSLVEVPYADSNMVDTLTFLIEEAREDALLIERFDKLSHHLANHGGCTAPGAFGRLAVLVKIFCLTGVELVDFPRSDTVIVFVPPYGRLQIAHDDPELQRFVEDRLAH
jgi:hypothetical protein